MINEIDYSAAGCCILEAPVMPRDRADKWGAERRARGGGDTPRARSRRCCVLLWPVRARGRGREVRRLETSDGARRSIDAVVGALCVGEQLRIPYRSGRPADACTGEPT